MNTSVSPLPVPVWPMLGLSLTLVALTATAVTLSGARANQEFRDAPPSNIEIKAPEIANRLTRRREARRTAARPAL